MVQPSGNVLSKPWERFGASLLEKSIKLNSSNKYFSKFESSTSYFWIGQFNNSLQTVYSEIILNLLKNGDCLNTQSKCVYELLNW